MVHDELNVLAAFLTVAQEQSFTRAAKRLGVSPSALSPAIKGLEEQIGIRLDMAVLPRATVTEESCLQLGSACDPQKR